MIGLNVAQSNEVRYLNNLDFQIFIDSTADHFYVDDKRTKDSTLISAIMALAESQKLVQL